MSGNSFQDLLDDAKASQSTDVDTSFLDQFRRTSSRPSVQTEAPENEQQNRDADVPQLDASDDPEVAVEGPAMEPEQDPPEVAPDSPGHARTPHAGRTSGRTDRRTNTGSTGGSASASVHAAASTATKPGPADGTDAGLAAHPKGGRARRELDAVLDAEDTEKLDRQAEMERSSHRKSDQQDAIQSAGTKGGAASGSEAAFPDSGFRIPGLQSQPLVRNLPRPLVDVLRAQLRAAAVRERGAGEGTAEAFSRRLSQGALVTAFLVAQLDVRLDTDPATQTAVELFRSQDPLLGSIAGRMDALEQRERDRGAQLERLHTLAAAIQETSAVIEQSVAYSIADRTENFLRGSHDIRDTPITHKDAIYIRDRAREETQKRSRFEHDQDGRPIR
ncbi:hypothetical protein F1D05_09995 [Kribbella qitaiheensis]|uniref:Uncharacterized protein n=1 Tax=Kribbella qitaiheensis TaxID=1544730 RepID=A0A7G6WVZ8_9ACTN|nr:hypothetical protein [Kribbella qitaiheensis]QNE18163.1 hypothetical protein F1D05_09995 [Kribbella qitaiheensis]